MVELIIFDYGRTLYDPDTRQLFPDAATVVNVLSKRYQLAIVSVSPKADEARHRQTLKTAGILHRFYAILFTDAAEVKSQLYDQMLRQFSIDPRHVAVVDDYVVRGVAWGNRVGATTVWFRNGKFSEILPTAKTGQPDHTIQRLRDLIDIFIK